MGDDLQRFLTDLTQEVAASASASRDYTRSAFVENLAKRLVAAEELQDWYLCYYFGKGHRRRTLAVDGYSADDLPLDGTVQVLIADERDGAKVEALTRSQASAALGRVTAFVEEAYEGRLHERLEPSTPAADLARLIYDRRDEVRGLRVLLLSNATLGARYREPERTSIGPVKVELQVWDLLRFQQLAGMGGREEVDIDVTALAKAGLPALPAGIGDAGYSAYLCVVPGSFLAEVYGRYGSRILEGNVRAFLTAKGSVNKGIRRTITSLPDKFFAFNNGITATASGVERDKAGNIVRIRDMQIVNGGQTTASLYNAREQDGASLDAVFVQMKLSVLSPDLAMNMIPDISMYANTQNKVSAADLFANDPFHRRVEDLSRRLWAPTRDGARQMTHWFYERARAQYQTEQSRLSASERKAFLIQNPKDQVITKTDLAKVENAWRKLPHLVSLGAQKNFVKYAEGVREEYDRDPARFDEAWFQRVVAKAIIFEATERLVSEAPWFTNAYRANIVAYALSRFVLLIDDNHPGRALDLDRVWKRQRVSEAVLAQLLATAKAAHGVLISPPTEWSNVTEWAKKERCWHEVASASVESVRGMEEELTQAPGEQPSETEARGGQTSGT